MVTIEPSWEEIDELRTPLTEGERHFVQRMEQLFMFDPDRHFEIFIQANINGDRPDIIVMERGQGIWIIEVKDWNLDLYMVDECKWYVKTIEREKQIIKSPFRQVSNYKNNIFDLHSHYLSRRKFENKSVYGMVRIGVYFHKAIHDKAIQYRDEEFKEGQRKFYSAFGSDTTDEQLKSFFSKPYTKINDHEYDHLMRYIRTSEEARPVREIDYNEKQLDLIESKPVRQKVKGVAGSGKSLVLAARAVDALERTSGSVLILTFNLTLVNYLHDRISEVRGVYRRNDFEIISYHRFINSRCNNYGIEISEKAGFGTDFSHYNDVNLFEGVKGLIEKYDAIFIDEVQDFEYNWLTIISKYFLKDNGEYVLFGDEKQNIYNRDLDDKQIHTNVVGSWNQLSDSYRLSNKTTELALAYQNYFFKERYEIDHLNSQLELDLIQEDADEVCYVYTDDVMNIMPDIQTYIESKGIHPNDIVFLGINKKVMREVDHYIGNLGEKTLTTFITKEEFQQLLNSDINNLKEEEHKMERPLKINFWMNSGSVKVSTIQSFKGWEANTIVLIISDSTESQQTIIDELIYTGLTRCKRNLIIINEGNEEMHGFFQNHQQLVDRFVLKSS